MAYPAIKASTNVVAGTGTSLSIPYPATVDADDILLASCVCRDAATWTAPSGWAKLSVESRRIVMWARASGTESGSLAFTHTNSIEHYGLMYSFSGCITSGDAYEITIFDQATSSTVSISDFGSDTTGPERLAVNICMTNGYFTANDNATNYTEESDRRSDYSQDAAFFLYSQEIATAGRPGSDSYTKSGTDYHLNVGFALIPASSSGYANSVNGVSPANIGDVNGVATADIDKVTGA